MAMTTRINPNFINQTDSDSASLTSTTTVVHRFPESGEYAGVVYYKENAVRSFRVGVAKEAGAAPAKVEVNLRALHLGRGSGAEESRYELAVGGYAVFRVPAGTGGGYAVEMHEPTGSGQGRKVFDSREPRAEDMLAVVVIRPGAYSIECTTEGGRKTSSSLKVSYPEKALKPVDPVKLTCGREGLSAGRVEVQPMQGLVFSFEAPSRVKVVLVTPEDRQRAPRPKPVHRSGERKRLTRRYSMVPVRPRKG